MKQEQFVKASVAAALENKGYGPLQVQQGTQAALRHYRQSSNFKPNALEACIKYALRSVGKPQK